jgi:antitoxin (DNA-binding transcriptional repressor) of toxin-antitoxin stability system
MSSVTLEQAQAQLPELISKLGPGEELAIMRDNQRIARIVAERPRRTPGLFKGVLTIIKDDDEHLKDFAEYM